MALTAKQEKFAQSVAEGMTQSAAYRAAYSTKNMSDGAIYTESSDLAAHPRVSLRIAELQAAALQRNEITVDSLTRDLKQAQKMCIDGNDPKGAVQAMNSLMKLHGLGLERKEVTVKDDVSKLSRAELEAEIAAVDEQIAAMRKEKKGNREHALNS